MQLTEVKDAATAAAFIQVNVVINKHDPSYIRPLDKDVEEVFDPKRNKAFGFGEVTRWILHDKNGALIGRIAAFINNKYHNKGDEGPVGGIGFFDCINDQNAADMLFDASRHWLLQRGMEAMDGPINFGERDRWWGLVVKGFNEPLYCMNYNQPYYQSLFETYGFRPFYNQLCFGMTLQGPFHKKLWNRHAAIANDPSYKMLNIDKAQLGKYAADFCEVYNKAWSEHEGMKELNQQQVLRMFEKMKPVMDEKIAWFVYHNNQPVSVFINLPDLNQWFKCLDGKFNWWNKLKLFWLMKKRPTRKMVGLVFGVIPEYQGRGLDAYMIIEASITLRQYAYDQYEMQWIGDFNPKMINVAKRMGETWPSRTLTTYRYNFDRTKEFKPHPVLL
ncbi:hypothetical protein HHL16_00625 [Pseudoflavitalea sp. G-6-1-2]|uniref:hypothetical protein n=1 Tax=Pseudoflavitalea sp. G-6-1-2 TaxID=2728841 RepID=UPI001469F048|nr:hypothetical protein [Pseudoflavitalea sp. G-6-1-2]NML19350.1 hypothetical protein [Pseudoflavitalea sp. G-6-1-2]